jgi:hypothetical protein
MDPCSLFATGQKAGDKEDRWARTDGDNNGG